ncbi:MAG: sulfatase-like hydrolase/transferase, partial [Myxococcota bacterium]|nr:sulfatase-like hydrolase/transferase [Myxococcota bacterium]
TAPEDTVARFSWPGYDGPVDGSMSSIGFLTRSRVEGTLRYGDARQARALYLAQVAYVDAEIGRLLRGIGERGLDEDSLVVVTADHGEVLDEDASRPYTHGPSTALEATHVPLVLRGKGRLALPVGVTVTPVVRLQDLASTVLGAVGIREAMGDGLDLAPLWSGRELEIPPAFSEATRPMNLEQRHKWNNANLERSVVDGGHQLRVRLMEGGLATLHRVAPGSPRVSDVSRIRAMGQLVKRWDSAAPAWVPPAYDAETRKALEALGYLDGADAREVPSADGATPIASPR